MLSRFLKLGSLLCRLISLVFLIFLIYCILSISYSSPFTMSLGPFPKPSGSFPVGCSDIVTKTGLNRSLFRLYYPTKPFQPSNELCPLWLDAPEYADGLASFMKFRPIGVLMKWFMGGFRIPIWENGPLFLPENGLKKFPVVAFSHGLAGNRFMYSHICYEIASHGFIVGAVEHQDQSASATFYLEENGEKNFVKKWLQYRSIPMGSTEEFEIRNSQVYERAKQCSTMLDDFEKLNGGSLTNIYSDLDLSQFSGKLDLSKCGIAGHSFGGATTIAALGKDPRFKVGVALDVWMFPLDKSIYKAKIEKPLLFINSEVFQWPSNIASIRKMDVDVAEITSERKMTTLLGAVHHTQCDMAFVIKYPWLARKFGLMGATDSKLANEINMKLLLGFIGKHLDLECTGEVEDVVEKNPNLVCSGTTVDVDEGRIKESKQKLRSEL